MELAVPQNAPLVRNYEPRMRRAPACVPALMRSGTNVTHNVGYKL